MNSEIIRAFHDIPRHLLGSAIHYSSASNYHTPRTVSEQEVCSYFHSSGPHTSGETAKDVNMVELSRMDSSSLIMAALAPSRGNVNLEAQSQGSYGSQPLAARRISLQEVRPTHASCSSHGVEGFI